ncbi:putative O-methyltransferase [Dactylonectria estremocensis]|uniref:O-methyltransferase n=1 Tax=Dactylonectria estremocensis TaxID=1079267 RepID=A0A9P9E203_9HYPO|nr:putative O-methyltransferase [Dactylonectria estremocensis]
MSHVANFLMARRQLAQSFGQTTRQNSIPKRYLSTTMVSASRDTWSAKQYSKFINERTRPAVELLNRVQVASPKTVVDLGCGPGNSTAVLAEKYPDANVAGIDSSPDMIQKAKATLPGVSFDVADLEAFKPDGPVDVLFSNAVFQWLPSGRRIQIITQLLEHLSVGGTLAFQIPFNMSEPSHMAMRETAFAPGMPWVDTLRHTNPVREEFPTPNELYDGLKAHCSELDIWRTTYIHIMENHEAIIEWVKGTGLRPFIDPLSEIERQEFLQTYLQRLRDVYPVQEDGKVLLPYPRLFVVATRG